MKKSVVSLIALVLAAFMMFSLVGCGNSNENPSNTPVNNPDSPSSNPGTSSNSPGGSSLEDPFFGDLLADGITVSVRDSKLGPIYEYTNSTGSFSKKTPADSIVIGGSSQVTSADPHTQVVEYPWTYNVYDSLLRKNPDTGEVEPWLATEYHFDDAGLLHFTLREGVKFHDGNIMTAEDVFFSIQRAAKAPRDRARDVLKFIDFDNSYIEDAQHVVFAFTEPCGAIISWMTSQATAIMSKEFVESVGPDYDYMSGDAGSGAYRLLSTITDVSQEFESFDEYWGGAPAIKHITYRRYSDFTAMMIDYENGDLDYSNLNTFESVMRVVNGEVPDTVLSRVPGARTAYVYLCQIGDVTPFTDIRLRQALAYSIDVEAIIEALYGGPSGADLAFSCLGPGMDGYVPIGAYEYNPEKAIELLAECGYSQSNPCSFKAFVNSGGGRDKDMELIQAYVNAVGFDMELVVGGAAQSTEANNTTTVPSEFQLLYGAGGDGCGDIFEAWVGMLAGNGHTGYSTSRGIPDDDWCLALDNATSATDNDARLAYLLEAQQIAYDEVLTVPLLSYSNFVMYRPYLSGIHNTSGYLMYWADLVITE